MVGALTRLAVVTVAALAPVGLSVASADPATKAGPRMLRVRVGVIDPGVTETVSVASAAGTRLERRVTRPGTYRFVVDGPGPYVVARGAVLPSGDAVSATCGFGSVVVPVGGASIPC